MEPFILGVLLSALFCIPIARNWGFNAAQEEFKREGSAMAQAQKRHREAMVRREEKLEFVHQCVDELQHVAHSSDVLSFCERQANKFHG